VAKIFWCKEQPQPQVYHLFAVDSDSIWRVRIRKSQYYSAVSTKQAYTALT